MTVPVMGHQPQCYRAGEGERPSPPGSQRLQFLERFCLRFDNLEQITRGVGTAEWENSVDSHRLIADYISI